MGSDDQIERNRPGIGLRGGAIVAMLLAVTAIFSAVDQTLSPAGLTPPKVAATAAPEPTTPPAERTLVLFVDSLPLAVTADPKLMPNLARFKAEAAWAPSSGCRDQVTVPAVRAAFSGRDHFRIFGFVENFAKGGQAFESIFDQWRAAGRKVLVYSDDSFDQFGAAALTHRAVDAPPQNQSLAAHQYGLFQQALGEFGDGNWDALLFHATFADETSHRVPHGGGRYRWAWSEVDRWIGQAMSVVQPDQNLMIMGDHGHDERGVHVMGLDLHTFVGVRGPRFAKGHELPEQPITSVRYLLSWATGTPLSRGYQGDSLPAALSSQSVVPGSFTRKALTAPARPAGWAVAALVALIGSLFGLWFFGQRRGFGLAGSAAVLVPSVLVLAAAHHAWGLPAAAAVALAALALRLRSDRPAPANDRRFAAAGAALTASMVGYGYVSAAQVLSERLSWSDKFSTVLTPALGVACVVCALLGPKWGSWLCAGAALLLLPTTNYAWGAVSVWGPLLLLVALAHATAAELPRFRDGTRGWSRAESVASVLAVLAVFWIVQQHWVVVGWDFKFRRFDPWFVALAWSGSLGWHTASLVAKFVFLVRWTRSWRLHFISFGGIALLTAYEWGLLPRASLYNVPLIAGLFAAAAVVPRLFAHPDTRRESRHVLLLVASMLAFFFLVRSPVNMHLSLAPAAAALGLSARLVRPLRPDVRRAAHVLLLCLGLIIAGWVGVCWSTTHVEWAFLSEHFGAEQIRSHILLFLPLLALRYALPVFVFRQVVQAELGDTDRQQHDWVWTAYGAKLGAVVAGTLGVGLAIGTTAFFLEGVQQAAVLAILGFGLLGLPRAARAQTPAAETSWLWGTVAAAAHALGLAGRSPTDPPGAVDLVSVARNPRTPAGSG